MIQRMTQRALCGQRMWRLCLRRRRDSRHTVRRRTLREGYLTLEGGHRVGVCGTLVLRGGEPYSMKDVTSLNIRVAHDIRMDSARLLPYLRENLLIIGAPGSGENNAAAGLHPDAQSDGTMCQRGG